MDTSGKLKLNISGMHCKSCELLIEDEIKNVPGVQKVLVDHHKGEAEVYFASQRPKGAELERAVRSAGYTVGIDKKRPFFSRRGADYIELFMAAGSLFILYAILKIFGVFDLNFQFSSSPSLLIVLLIGLTAGVSTCMALTGGLVLSISARHAELHPEASRAQKFKPHIFFNLGRLVSYAVLGGLIGLVGSAFQFSPLFLGGLIIAVGFVMLFLGVKLIGVFPRLEGRGLTLPKWLARLFGLKREVKEYSHRGAFVAGALTFFLPCGFTQSMQLYAMSTGSFFSGAAIMFAFALGTMPGIIGVGGLTSILRGGVARQFFKFVGVTVILLGLFNMRNGFNVTGITVTLAGSSGFTEDPAKSEPLPNIVGAAAGKDQAQIQVIKMEQAAAGYYPNRLSVKKGIPVKWIINSTNSYTCASFLVVPSLGINKALSAGENVLEFTPTKAGLIKFSCSMGMFTGFINVTE